MRRREAPLSAMFGEAPPRKLLRFVPSAPAPIGPHGRPEPWAVKWTAEDFAAWLRARAAWRDSHAEPLPGLPARERCAIHGMKLPAALVQAEERAPRRPPEWWAHRRTTTTTKEGRD